MYCGELMQIGWKERLMAELDEEYSLQLMFKRPYNYKINYTCTVVLHHLFPICTINQHKAIYLLSINLFDFK